MLDRHQEFEEMKRETESLYYALLLCLPMLGMLAVMAIVLILKKGG